MINWPTKKLGEVVEIQIGGTPSRNNPQYWGGNNAWGTISELNGQEIYDTKEHITDLGVANSNVKPIPPGTTLMSFKLSLGKVATAGSEIYTNEAIAGLIPKTNEIQNKWLFYSLPTINYDKYVSGAAKGKTLNKAILQTVEIQVPPTQTQQKIVERLDSIRNAQELCDTQIQKTEELFESLLFSEFKSIKNEVTKKLPDIAVMQRGKFTPRPRNDPRYFGGNIPWIQTGDVSNSDGEISSYSQTLNNDGLKVSRVFSKGTIVITIAANIGDLAILKIDAAFPDSLVGITAESEIIDNKFLYYQLLLQKENLSNQATTAAQKNINLQVLSDVDVVAPSIEKQEQIVKKLDAVQDYKKLLLKQKSLFKELFDSVLYKSMNGEMDN